MTSKDLRDYKNSVLIGIIIALVVQGVYDALNLLYGDSINPANRWWLPLLITLFIVVLFFSAYYIIKVSLKDKNKIRWWQTKYTWFTIVSVIIAFLFPFLMDIASFLGWVLVLKEQILIALLGVEATIFGFFGLIFVNGLASFRSIFEILARGFDKQREPKDASDYARAWWEAHSATTENRIAYINHSLVTGAFLISSIFSVILALAVTSGDWNFYLSYLSIGILLIVCIPQILWAIRDLGKDTYQNWSQPIFKP